MRRGPEAPTSSPTSVVPPEGDDSGAWIEDLDRFVHDPTRRTLNDADEQRLLHGANVAFTLERLESADAIYAFLLERDRGGYFAKLRRADIARIMDDVPTALRRSAELVDDPDYDFRGEVVRAMALLADDQPQEAAEHLLRAVAAHPERGDFVRLLVGALERADDIRRLSQPEAFVGGLEPGLAFEYVLRARTDVGELETAKHMVAERPEYVRTLNPDTVSRLLRTFEEQGEYPTAVRIAELSRADESLDPAVLATLLTLRCSLGEWELVEGTLVRARDVLWRTRNLELFKSVLRSLCLAGDPHEAGAVLDRWGPMHDILPGATVTVMVVLSALSRLEDVIAFMADRVDQHFPVWDAQVVSALLHAARETQRYDDAVALLERALDDDPSERGDISQMQLLLEQHLFAELGITQADSEILTDHRRVFDRLAWWRFLLTDGDGDPGGDGAASVPGTAQSPTPPPAAAADRRTATERTPVDGGVFFCTDGNYLVGACTAVWSYLRNNRDVETRWPVTVFCHRDACALATALFDRMTAATGVPIRVVDASSLTSAATLRTDWGVFTSHPGLTDATYYRVFGARWLVDHNVGGRAVYLDADSVPGAGVRRLFEEDLDGHALGARTDADLPGVRQAAARLGLSRDQYFNAGVMIIDLAHDQVREALTRAIDFAEHHARRITFFDQCALNVGFAGLRATVPNSFNSFVVPNIFEADRFDDEVEPVVRHYIGPPKPWDPVYLGDRNRRWLVEFAALDEVLTRRELRLLLTMALTPRSRRAP